MRPDIRQSTVPEHSKISLEVDRPANCVNYSIASSDDLQSLTANLLRHQIDFQIGFYHNLVLQPPQFRLF